MENKNIGWLIVGISIFIFIMIGIFHYGVNKAIGDTCSMGPTCGMYDTLNIQTWLSLALGFVVLVIGIFFIFAKTPEKVITNTITKTITKKEPKKKISLDGLDKQEKEVINIIQKEGGAIFQATLMEALGSGKVGITRLLDKLEAKQLIERKRRGMNNIVVLKTH